MGVLEAGSEPQRVAKNAPLASGSTERVETSFKLRMNTAFTNTVLETGHTSADFPTIEGVVRIEVTSVANDVALVRSEVEKITVLEDVVDPAVRARVVGEIDANTGKLVSWRMTTAGRISDVVAEPGKGAARLVDAVRESVVIFPDVAIGVGAKWRVTSVDVAGGVTWERTATYTLKALTESSATVDRQFVMRASPQALSVEPNATTRLTSGSSNSNGEVTVLLRGLAATGSTSGTSEINLSIVRGRTRVTSTIQAETLFSVKPASNVEQ